jgi:hypothetical protein
MGCIFRAVWSRVVLQGREWDDCFLGAGVALVIVEAEIFQRRRREQARDGILGAQPLLFRALPHFSINKGGVGVEGWERARAALLGVVNMAQSV